MDISVKYFSKLDQKNKTTSKLDELYDFSKLVEGDYPNHYNWFYNKFVKELDGVIREIIYCEVNNNIVGIACLKNTEEEKKICTLIVKEEFQGIGIGSLLLQHSFKFLATKKPLITMPEYKVKNFSKIIDKYNWKIFEEIDSEYSNNKEIAFNGYLKRKVR